MAFVNVLFIKDLGGYVVDTDSFPAGFISLQKAYEGGNTISLDDVHGGISIGTPVLPNPSIPIPFMISTSQDSIALYLFHQADVAGTPALRIYVNPLTSVGCDAIQVQTILDEAIIRAYNSLTLTGPEFILSMMRMEFPSETTIGLDRAAVQTGTAPAGQSAAAMVLRGGAGDTGDLAGIVSVGHATGLITEDGGFALDPVTGRMQLRAHNNGTINFGTLGLVDNPAADEATAIPAVGDVHYRSEAGAGDVREHGFRGYANGAYGLFGRGYQELFGDGELVGGVLTANCQLGSIAPIVQLWEEIGGNWTCRGGTSADFVVTVDGPGDNVFVTFDPGVLPLANLWYITIMGF
jgi:hypothetical protein